ncbi:MAG: triphosphoribosyl-dephospho-CoA synthase [Christensenellales bacterium]
MRIRRRLSAARRGKDSPGGEAHFAGLTAAHSFGERLYLQAGIRGIRGEAAEGFPSIMAVWPDFVREATQLSQQEAGVRAVIRLLSRMQDTTLLKRGDRQGRRLPRRRRGALRRRAFPEAEIEALDEAMIARNLTCGGCADLLACLYFLYATASSEQWQENLP